MKKNLFIACVFLASSYLAINIITTSSYNLLATPASETNNSNTTKNYKLTGIVKNSEGKSFPLVYVFIKEHKKIKTATRFDGSFVLNVPDSIRPPFNLEFSSVDYITKTYNITAKNRSKKIQIVLEKDRSKLVADSLALIAKENKEKSSSRGKTDGKKLLGKEIGKESGSEENVRKGTDFATLDITERASTIGSSISKDAGGSSESITVTAARASLAKVDAKAKVDTKAAGEVSTLEVEASNVALPSRPPQQEVAAGMLTAGELNDFTKWTLWGDIAEKQLDTHQKQWRILPKERYVAQLTNTDKMPIVDAMVYLKDKQDNIIWQARTDNTGKAELWSEILDDGLLNTGAYKIVFSYKDKTAEVDAMPFPKKINSAILKVNCSEAKQVDVQFIVDATGSMGDEIKYLQAELYDVIEKVQQNNSNIQLRIGSVFYRDNKDEYLTRKLPLDKDINKTLNFIKQQSAAGGGDYPEAVDIALTEAIENENWNENALARIAFLILDAPPHQDTASIERVHRQIRLAAMKGVRIVPLVCSGADKSTEYLMRSIALATNGTYVFLTDESGIGDPHIKPTTDKYEVEKLNHILLRIITEFSQIPNCSNNWTEWDTELTSQEKFMPKPYKEKPDEDTERLVLTDIINIYPNPCNGELSVNLLRAVSDLYLVDVTGKALQNFSFENPTSLVINLSDYSAGTYFINAFYQGRWYVIKFLLTK